MDGWRRAISWQKWIKISVSVGNSHLDQSLTSELGCTWNGNVQLNQFPQSRQDAASQTDLFAYELERLKQSMAEDPPERKHFFAIEEDDCSLPNIPLEEEDGEGNVASDYGKLGSAVEDEVGGETERSLEEELRSSIFQARGQELESSPGRDDSQQQESVKTFLWEEKTYQISFFWF